MKRCGLKRVKCRAVRIVTPQMKNVERVPCHDSKLTHARGQTKLTITTWETTASCSDSHMRHQAMRSKTAENLCRLAIFFVGK